MYTCGMFLSFILLVLGEIFTTRRTLRAVQDVRNTDLLGYHLCVPELKRNEISHQFSNIPEQQRSSLIKYWIERDPLASWRGLIVALDGMGQKKVADGIRHLAEPLTGKMGSSLCKKACAH